VVVGDVGDVGEEGDEGGMKSEGRGKTVYGLERMAGWFLVAEGILISVWSGMRTSGVEGVEERSIVG